MTTDEPRDLTETELGFLGWRFEIAWETILLSNAFLNDVFIYQDKRDDLIKLANRFARAQGITPPVFQVGERATIGEYWGLSGKKGTVTGIHCFEAWEDVHSQQVRHEWHYEVVLDKPVEPGIEDDVIPESKLERMGA